MSERNVVVLRRTEHSWEAVIYLPPTIDWRNYVNGQDTPAGPWVGALGETPDLAYENALHQVGLAVVALSEFIPEKAP